MCDQTECLAEKLAPGVTARLRDGKGVRIPLSYCPLTHQFELAGDGDRVVAHVQQNGRNGKPRFYTAEGRRLR